MKRSECDLASCFFCSNCNSEWLELTRLKKQTYLFKKGEQLFTEGADVTGMYFMLSGSAKVHKHWGDKELIIRFAKGGDILGIRGFGDRVFRVSATALEETRACFIPESHLQASLRINASLSYKLMQFYAAELDFAEQRMSDLAHRDVKGRIADTLLRLRELFGENDEGFISVPVSRQDIAAYAGTTYETVFKIFTEWTAHAYISTEGKHIRIQNRDGLVACIV